jgi:hypothetical protein
VTGNLTYAAQARPHTDAIFVSGIAGSGFQSSALPPRAKALAWLAWRR